jgi:diaminohydroxyphosphoribosylaminopyrimidine deaminase / 5-amino-6-(5-phosphoribosylamino)uracil reductase
MGAKNSWTERDIGFMKLALALADAAKGTTFPNPAVGAVVVNRGKIVGKGATSPAGGPHAERNALADAGEKARGAAMYVTLEPCRHFGKTSPCTDAIIEAGIRTVFASVGDPNRLVEGKGFSTLRKAGIEVRTGLCAREAERLNEDFFFWITRRRPWVSVKLAMTLDGRITDAAGGSRWITSVDSRKFVHDLRRKHAAVAVGRLTLEKDNPRLTVRHGKSGNPARIVFSSRASVPPNSYFLKNAAASRSILVMRGGVRGERQRLDNGIELWRTGDAGLRGFLAMAAGDNIPSVLVEGGGGLASAFLESGLANRVYLMYGNKILGGGRSGLDFSRPLRLSRCLHLDEIEISAFGGDAVITGVPRRR